MKSELKEGVNHVVGTCSAFAAVKQDGSVVTWGSASHGGNSDDVRDQLTGGVDHVVGTSHAFAAVKEDGSVVTWGDAGRGGNSDKVKDQLTGGVDNVVGTQLCFCRSQRRRLRRHVGIPRSWRQLRLREGSTDWWCRWETKSSGTSMHAFAAVKDDGSVVTWGHADSGGNSDKVKTELAGGVVHVVGADYAFAAVKEDGSVVTWGP